MFRSKRRHFKSEPFWRNLIDAGRALVSQSPPFAPPIT
jgi:hypothetical protein